MTLKELLAKVQKWHDQGLGVQCTWCGKDLTIRAEDKTVSCKKCESVYDVKPFILSEIEPNKPF